MKNTIILTQRKNKNMKIAYIVWRDACKQHKNAITVEEFDDECYLQSVGFVARETKEVISLTSQYESKWETHETVTHIPKNYIKSIKILGKVDE